MGPYECPSGSWNLLLLTMVNSLPMIHLPPFFFNAVLYISVPLWVGSTADSKFKLVGVYVPLSPITKTIKYETAVLAQV